MLDFQHLFVNRWFAGSQAIQGDQEFQRIFKPSGRSPRICG
jgi:hypothetical protein